MKNKLKVLILLIFIVFLGWSIATQIEKTIEKNLKAERVTFYEELDKLQEKLKNTDINYSKMVFFYEFINKYQENDYFSEDVNIVINQKNELVTILKDEANSILNYLESVISKEDIELSEQDFNSLVIDFNSAYGRLSYDLAEENKRFSEIEIKLQKYYRVEKLKRRFMNPIDDWVGKTLEITFSSKNVKSLRNRTFVVKLVSVKTDIDGYKYFVTEFPYTEKGHQKIYFDWYYSKMISDSYEVK